MSEEKKKGGKRKLPPGAKCICTRPAYRVKWNDYVCEACDAWEKSVINSRIANSLRKLDTLSGEGSDWDTRDKGLIDAALKVWLTRDMV